MSKQEQTPPAQEQAIERLVAEESVFSIKAFDHAQRVAKMLSSSSLIPKIYQGNIQNTMIALEMAHRIGASPLMVMQNLYVVHGNPGWSSAFIIASINSCGRFNSLRFDLTGSGNDMKCVAWTTEKAVKIGEGIKNLGEAKKANLPVLEGAPISMKMAKDEGWLDKNGSKWKTMPELMIRYRAAAFWGRLYSPEIMMGMQTTEEVVDVDYREVAQPSQPRIDLPTVEDLEKLLASKVNSLNADEFKNATRIIEDKEVASYQKLKTLLDSKTE